MEERTLLKQVQEFENLYKLNSFEMLEKTEILSKEWKNITEMLLFSDTDPFSFNKINEFKAKYFIKEDDMNTFKKKIQNEYTNKDGNIILVTNKDMYYKGIIKRFNQNSKIVYLISDDKNDLKLKEIYENLIIKITDNPKKFFRKLSLERKILFI